MNQSTFMRNAKAPVSTSRVFALMFAVCGMICPAMSISQADAAPAAVGFVTMKGENMHLTAGDYSLVLGKKHCWTIRSLSYKKRSLMAAGGGCSNGTVLKTPMQEAGTGKWKGKWVGSGHGYETVESVTLLVDGKEKAVKPGVTYEGSVFTVVKHSDLRVLKLESTLEFSAAGIRETNRYTAKSDRPRVNLLYGFMHSFDVHMTEWVAAAPQGERQQGQFSNPGKNAFKGDLAWTSVYNPKDGVGAVYVFHTPLPSPHHFYWDRKKDQKLYFKPTLNTKAMKAGDQFAYTVSVAGYESPGEKWTETAQAVAAKLMK